jgi:hypothetical protein
MVVQCGASPAAKLFQPQFPRLQPLCLTDRGVNLYLVFVLPVWEHWPAVCWA